VAEGHEPPAPIGQVRMRLEGAGEGTQVRCVDLRGPTRCEVLDHEAVAVLRARLGPDPLDPAVDPDRAWARIARSARPIGA
ncbi:MAG: Fpg/Nei family DNA glycosylase, partial [Dietzia sp.]